MDKWTVILILGCVALSVTPLIFKQDCIDECADESHTTLKHENDSLILNLDECVERYDEAIEAIQAL